MLVVGLTGGIATGKSTVSRMLAELGAVIVDADRIAHELQRPGQAVHAAIVEAFGAGSLTATGEIDRAALGAIVFADPAARARLEALTHPAIVAESERRVAEAGRAGAAVCVVDAALLVETGRYRRFDRLVVVVADEATQVARLMARNGCSREEALGRIRAQLPLGAKVAVADDVIDNSGNLAATGQQVRELYARLRGLADGRRPEAPPGGIRPPPGGAGEKKT
jgi:dephospho-CoA kinase